MFPKCQHILISPNPKSKYKTKFKFRIKNSSYYFNTVIDIYEIFKYLYNIIAIEQQHILHHYNFFSQNTFTQSVLQISFKLYLSTCFKLYLSTCFKLYLSTCFKLYLSTCFKLYLSTCFKLYLSTCFKLYLSTCFKHKLDCLSTASNRFDGFIKY
jgi:hypothetical protein